MGPGGRIHLLHVHPRRLGEPGFADHYGVLPEPPAERERVLRQLQALVPQDSGGRALERGGGDRAGRGARAICQAAEREGVDLVCVGATESHLGRVGGVARELMARCHRPVLVVPAPAEAREPSGWGPEGSTSNP